MGAEINSYTYTRTLSIYSVVRMIGHNKVGGYLRSRDSMALERMKARKITLSKKNHNMDRSLKPCVKSAPFYYNTDNRSVILNLPNFIASRLFRG